MLTSIVRSLTVRRSIAAAFILAAVFFWLRPVQDDSVPMLVAARALAPGTDLTSADIRVVRAPPDLVPDSAFADPAAAVGRTLTGAAVDGEPITEARLVGPAAVGPGSAAVPVRLSDPLVAGLLRPGARVDVVTAGKREDDAVVLARDATVVTIRADPDAHGQQRGSLLLIALTRDNAAKVASISLEKPVTVTLR